VFSIKVINFCRVLIYMMVGFYWYWNEECQL